MIPPEEQPRSYIAPKPLKLKIEFTDNSGNKYSFNVEGNSRENIDKILDLANSISTSTPPPLSTTQNQQLPTDTNFSKLLALLRQKFPFGSFNSTDLLQAYQTEFHTSTTLSIISTYLSRMARRGLVLRTRNGSAWTYKLARPNLHQQFEIPKQETNPFTGTIPP